MEKASESQVVKPKLRSNIGLALVLVILAISAGWFHWRYRFIKNSLFRWIALALISAFVLGFLAAIFNRFG